MCASLFSLCSSHALLQAVKIQLKLILIFQLAFSRLFLLFVHIALHKQFSPNGKGEKQVL